MQFKTRSGSLYEIDTTNQQIRRLNGTADPTPRQGADGEYRKYVELFPLVPTVGQSLLIVWDKDVIPPPAEGSIPTTITSPVVELIGE
jgi:hypothetical protein